MTDYIGSLIEFLKLNFPKEWGLSKEEYKALLDVPSTDQPLWGKSQISAPDYLTAQQDENKRLKALVDEMPIAQQPDDCTIKPCPFCGGEIDHVESWARSFAQPKLYHEYHHPKNNCVLMLQGRGYRIASFTDDPAPRMEFIAAWNTRTPLMREAGDYPDCSGDVSSCPENEGYGCCKPNPKRRTK